MKQALGVCIVMFLTVLAVSRIEAKRGPPKDVPPVTRDGIVYSAPHEHMGFVFAKNEKAGQVAWKKQIYVVKYDLDLETDIQDCFITDLRFADGKLLIANEKGGEFELNPDTLAVKVLKGTDVIDHKTEKKK